MSGTPPKPLEEPLGSMTASVIEALEAADIGLTITRDAGDGPRPIYMSETAARIMGYPRDELMQLPSLANIAPEELPRMAEQAAARRAGKLAFSPHFETVVVTKDGRRVPVEVGVGRFSQDALPITVAFIRDISARRALEAKAALTDRMATVGAVAAGVAHEVNNPLTYLMLNLDRIARALPKMVRDPSVVTEIASAVESARDGAQRVREIIADLRPFERAVDTELREVDVRAVMRSAVNLAAADIRGRARLIEDLQPVPPVPGSEGRLGQVFLNLLVNAAQAIPAGAPDDHQIRVSTRAAAASVIVEVSDTGCGMPPEVLRRVFDPFFTTKPSGEGTGLGLAICHKIVTTLGGEIQAESQVGVGSVFRVTLRC